MNSLVELLDTIEKARGDGDHRFSPESITEIPHSGVVRDLFSIRERRARTTKKLVGAQSVVIKDPCFAYELVTRRPEIRQRLEEHKRREQ